MFWIPVIFLCAETCLFIQGQAEYSLIKCQQSVEAALMAANADPRVVAVEGTCVIVAAV
jgi:hypothetical protein